MHASTAPRPWMRTVAPAVLVAAALASGCQTTRPQDSATVPPGPPASASQSAAASSGGWQAIGHSAEGRPLLVAQSGSGPLRVFVVGGIHGDETEGRSALEAIRAAPEPGATIRILRDLNPDGTARGQRTNANGRDLNRNWPATNFTPGYEGGPVPLSEAETRLLQKELRNFAPHVVVVLHSSPEGPFVNYDGPAGELASAFARTASDGEPWRVKPDMGYPTPGSLGSYLGVDRSVPTLTLEFRRGQAEAVARRALESRLAAMIRAASMP